MFSVRSLLCFRPDPLCRNGTIFVRCGIVPRLLTRHAHALSFKPSEPWPPEEHRNKPKAWVDLIIDDYKEYAARAGQLLHEEITGSTAVQTPQQVPVPGPENSQSLDIRVSHVLVNARRYAKVNLILYLGVEQTEWRMASWVVRAITERPLHEPLNSRIMGFEPLAIENRSHLPRSDNMTMRETSQAPIWYQTDAVSNDADKIGAYTTPNHTNGSTSLNESLSRSHIYEGSPAESVRIEATGDILSTTASLILRSYTSNDLSHSQSLMTHMLDILAILHHNGIVPEFTYQSFPESSFEDRAAPAYLDELVQPILSAILDAEWNLFQDSPNLAPYASAAQRKLPGYEFAKHNNPQQILPYAHEIWLELILWICLRGSWIRPGLRILRDLSLLPAHLQWTAQSWRTGVPESLEKDWIMPVRNLSEELITAYLDTIATTAPLPPISAADSTQQASSDLQLLRSFLPKRSEIPLVEAHAISQSLLEFQVWRKPSHAQMSQLSAWAQFEPIATPVQVFATYTNRLFMMASSAGDLESLSNLFTVLEKNIQVDPRLSATGERQVPVFEVVPAASIACAIYSILDSNQNHSKVWKACESFVHWWLARTTEPRGNIEIAALHYANETHDAMVRRNVLDYERIKLAATNEKADLQAAIACGGIENGSFNNVGNSLRRVNDWRAVSADWHIRVIIALAKRVLSSQVKARHTIDLSDKREAVAAAELLESHLWRLLALSLPARSRSSILTVSGMLASIDQTWRALITRVLRQSGIVKQKLQVRIDATLPPNLAAGLLTEIWHHSGTDTVRDIWNKWCESAPAKSRSQMSRDAFLSEGDAWQGQLTYCELDDGAQIIVRRKITPNLPMISALALGDRTGFRSHDERWEQVRAMCSAYGMKLGQLLHGVTPLYGPYTQEQWRTMSKGSIV